MTTIYLLWEHVSAPRARALGRKDLKWSAVVRKKPTSETQGVCVGVALVLGVCTGAVVRWLELSPVGTSKSFITELRCWNIVRKFHLM